MDGEVVDGEVMDGEVMDDESLSPVAERCACCCQWEGKRIAITAAGAGSPGAGAAWAAPTAVLATALILVEAISGVMRTVLTVPARATAGPCAAALLSAATSVEPAPGERAALV
ncbi:MAG: hypothetical protein K2Y71_04410 [Xanthobacteraceae bacterium]|nr:hypothetical protein [Xanthobacteraceae bacterium]